MTSRRVPSVRAPRLPALLLVASGLVGCASDSPSDPRVFSVRTAGPVAAKTGGGPAVSSANPSYGDQGTTITVQILGSGFTTGATATWLLNGVADSHVQTNSTQFVSSSEVDANITIAPDASLALWDVQVALIGGKNGVGSDAFEVTSAQVLSLTPVVSVEAANNLGDVAGYLQSDAFVYDDATGLVDLGLHQARGLDPDATTALGTDGAGNAVAWTHQPDGSFTQELLPSAPSSSGRMATSAARMADGTLLAGGVDATPGVRKGDTPFNRPVVWQRVGSSWSAPTVYAYPAGVTRASTRAVNALGQIVGEVNASATGAVWDDPTLGILLDGMPNGINSAGTLIVGYKAAGTAKSPAFWWRDPSTHAWHTTGVLLPTVAGAGCTSGAAHSLNDAGVVVGRSCNSSGKDQATVWHLDFSGPAPVLTGQPTALSGLGPGSSSPISDAVGVSSTAPYLVGGFALSGGKQLVVRWILPQ